MSDISPENSDMAQVVNLQEVDVFQIYRDAGYNIKTCQQARFMVKYHKAGHLTNINDIPTLLENMKTHSAPGTKMAAYLGYVETFVNKNKSVFIDQLNMTEVQWDALSTKLNAYKKILKGNDNQSSPDYNHRDRNVLSTKEAEHFDLETFEFSKEATWKLYKELMEVYLVEHPHPRSIRELQLTIILLIYIFWPNNRSIWHSVMKDNFHPKVDNFIMWNHSKKEAIVTINWGKVDSLCPYFLTNLDQQIVEILDRFVQRFRSDSDFLFLDATGKPFKSHSFTNAIRLFVIDKKLGNVGDFGARDLRTMQISEEKRKMSAEDTTPDKRRKTASSHQHGEKQNALYARQEDAEARKKKFFVDEAL